MSWLVDVTNTWSVAVERELVASTRRVVFARSYSARVIEMVSAAGAVALIVSVATREVPLAVAVIRAEVAVLTCVVLMEKLVVVASAATVTLAGTRAAALLLDN